MLKPECVNAINRAMKIASEDGTSLIALTINPDRDETALVSLLPEGSARAILERFIMETDTKVLEVTN